MISLKCFAFDGDNPSRYGNVKVQVKLFFCVLFSKLPGALFLLFLKRNTQKCFLEVLRRYLIKVKALLLKKTTKIGKKKFNCLSCFFYRFGRHGGICYTTEKSICASGEIISIVTFDNIRKTFDLKWLLH